MPSSTLKDDLAARATPAPLAGLLCAIADACALLAREIARGDITTGGGSTNASGETQQALDVRADALFIEMIGNAGLVSGMVSEEQAAPWLPPVPSGAPYLLAYDPLDGSSNIPVNVSIGSIFSVLPAPRGWAPKLEDFLQPGTAQLAAGFCVYGPSTVLVLTTGTGMLSYALDPDLEQFVTTDVVLDIPPQGREYAINASNQRFWEAPVQRYVAECVAGKNGPRGADFNMRWVASMVADVYRVLRRGGIFMYPYDTKDAAKPGKLRLMYEAAPMSLIVEQAGGAASTGRQRLLEVTPQTIHQRVPVILGAREEVQRLEAYHREA